MCRMIAVTGTFDASLVVPAWRSMAANACDHPHERRSRGDSYRHVDGWGAVWLQGSALATSRRPKSCLADPAVEEIAFLQTRFLVLHARRASRGDASEANTHPFVIEHGGRRWAFVHNGSVDDLGPLARLPGVPFTGDTDSERLFHHLLARLDPARAEDSLREALGEIDRYTAMNALLATDDRFYAVAWPDPATALPRYFTLWRGEGPGLTAVSSEPLASIGCRTWTPLARDEGAPGAPRCVREIRIR